MKLNFKTFLKYAAVIFLLYLAMFYWENVSSFIKGLIGATTPLIVGCIIAYLINILMSFYEKHYFPKFTKKWIKKTRRPICIALAFLSMVAIVTLIGVLIIPQLVICVKLLVAKLPNVFASFTEWMEKFDFVPKDALEVISNINWKSQISQIVNVITNGVGGVMDTVMKTVSTVFSSVVSAFIGIIFSVYLLASKEKLGKQFNIVSKTYLSDAIYLKIRYIITVLNDNFKRYIVGQCTEAVILGALCTIGMTVLRLPYAPAIGALIAFTALIPIAGAYLGASIGAFLILSDSPAKALIFLIFLIILQQIEGNIIYPKVVGSSLGLPGIWVLAAVTIGGGLLGIGGMIIGVPLTSAIYKIIKDDVIHKKTYFKP